ncbi:hypothetical protein CRG98_044681 [Punica granatum]|uniref:Uncharacterized protein n=1 Tax=Punica granatum TaxID=22663 RepID=A0A2I0HTY5_PUNGR|nr:hypothetical protein CRG98_044681 [Punica granatum]
MSSGVLRPPTTSEEWPEEKSEPQRSPRIPIGGRAPAIPIREVVTGIKAPAPKSQENPQIGDFPYSGEDIHDSRHHSPIGVVGTLPRD